MHKNQKKYLSPIFFSTVLGIALLALPWCVHGTKWPQTISTQLGHCPIQNCDFLNHYLPQAQKIHIGDTQLQEGWFYPPTLAIGIEPILMFPAGWISHIWTMMNLCVLGCFIFLVNKEFDMKEKTALLWPIALCTTSMPVLSSIKWGQISLFIVALCWWDLRQKRSLSGLGIGLAGALKGFPMVYLLWPLWKKNTALFVRAISTLLVIGGLIPIIRIGFEQTTLHYQNMISAGQHIQTVAPLWGGQAFAPSMHRWFINGNHMMDSSPPLLFPIPEQWFPWVFMAVSGGVSIFVLRALSKHPEPLVLLFCWLGLLFSPGWQHYFCFLPLCMVVIWKKSTTKGKACLVLAGMIERIPVLGLGSIPHIYYNSSAWGTTTIATMIVLYVALVHVSCSDHQKNVE